MKKAIFYTISIIGLTLIVDSTVLVQGMPAPYRSEASAAGMGTNAINSDGHTAREEAEGKAVWEKLQATELTCKDLSDDNFGALGEYFMGQMMGDSHAVMNTMMEQMMGEEGEKQMHVVMGKRLSGCEPNAPMTQNMMGGGMMGGSNSMMGNFATNPTGWFGLGLGWIFVILFWGFIILAIVALIKWIMNQGKHEAKSRVALDILKERYAKGEIDKKEFEGKKKDLT